MSGQLGVNAPMPPAQRAATEGFDSVRVDYAGRRFQPRGAIGPTGSGLYHHEGSLVWAEFSGPTVTMGRLVGTSDADGVIDAAYSMVTADGQVVAGTLQSTPTVRPDGRVELLERWRRMDGTSGVTYLEEVPA